MNQKKGQVELLLRELEEKGLIKRKTQRKGCPERIYILHPQTGKPFYTEDIQGMAFAGSGNL